MEFALVGLPFVMFLIFLLEIGYDFYAQAALDYGVQITAREIQIGRAQDATTAAMFQTKYLCPALVGLLPCSSISVNVMPVGTDFYTAVPAALPINIAGQLDTSGWSYCPGRPNQLMLFQAVYVSPSLVSAIVPNMATAVVGGFAQVTLAAAAFVNENFPVSGKLPAAC